MTPASVSRLRLVMSAATGLLMIACIVVIWANPQPMVGAHTASAAVTPVAAGAGNDPCDLVIGAARTYCQTADASVPTTTASAATGNGSVRNGVLLCSGLAITAALALIKTAGRQTR